jgi:hypothetical protein
VPETMRLFELVGNDYVINLTDAMTGRVALPSGVTDVAQARSSGVAKRTGNYNQLKLTDDSRGKVVIGDTTFLFQFVAPPPVQPKPQLPLAVKGGLASQIDWSFTIIAAFSFLLHFGLAGAVNSDWFDPEIDEDAETAALIQQAKDRPAPPIEEKKEEATDTAVAKADDKKDTGPKAADKKGAAPGPKGGGVTAKNADALSKDLDALEMKALGRLQPRSGRGQGGRHRHQRFRPQDRPRRRRTDHARPGRRRLEWGRRDQGRRRRRSRQRRRSVREGQGARWPSDHRCGRGREQREGRRLRRRAQSLAFQGMLRQGSGQ